MKFNATLDTVCNHIEAGIVDFIRSSPGVGKTALAKQAADEFNLEPVVIYFANKLPEEVNGAPEPYDVLDKSGKVVKRALRYLQFDNIPAEDWDVPKGKDGWLLILDEATSTPEATQPTLFRLVQEREFGETKLHPDCSVIMLGNLLDDNGVVFEMPTPLLSKVAHILMEPDVESWLALARNLGWDVRVIRWISARPEYINNFKPDELNDTDNPTFCCQRTLEMLSKVIHGRTIDFKNVEELRGVIGKAAAIDFISFIELADKVPSKSQLLADEHAMPYEPEKQLYVSTLLADWLTEAKTDNEINQWCRCINKLDVPMQAMTFRHHLRYAQSANISRVPHEKVAQYMTLLGKISEALTSY